MGERPLWTDDLGSRKAEAGDFEDEVPVKKKTREKGKERKGAWLRDGAYSVP